MHCFGRSEEVYYALMMMNDWWKKILRLQYQAFRRSLGKGELEVKMKFEI